MSNAIIYEMMTAPIISRCDSDFCSRHTVGVPGVDIMHHILESEIAYLVNMEYIS